MTTAEADCCPVCDSPAADVSWQTAPHQSVCDTDDCPVNTWDSSTPRPDQRWDARIERSELRKRTTRAWGPDAQKNKAAEECSELAAALNRDLNGQQDHDELLKEFIDARVMLWQLTLMFTEEELEAALDEALDDLEHRLEVYG
jgi:hypothetical protein